MCIIIASPVGETIPQDHITRSANRNNDGFGFYAFGPEGNKVFRTHDFYDFNRVIQDFNTEDHVLVAHFRFTTHGNNKEKNLHPFLLKEGWWMFHNGIFGDAIYSKTYSDTYMVAEQIKKFSHLSENIDAIKELMHNMTDSRVVFVNKDEIYIVNQEFGVWKGDTWYSNDDLFSFQYSFRYGSYGQAYYPNINSEYGPFTDEYMEQGRGFGEYMDQPEDIDEFYNMIHIYKEVYGEVFPQNLAQQVFEWLGYGGMLPTTWPDLRVEERRFLIDAIMDHQYDEL